MNEWSQLQNGSDIRGVAVDGVAGQPVTLHDSVVRAIGCAFAQWLAQRLEKPARQLQISVGHDSRISAEKIKGSIFQGLTHAGASIYDCGLASTPAMFMSTIFTQHSYDGAMMLTASHLPFNRNGIKFFTRHGGLEKRDITKILKMAETISDGVAPTSVTVTPVQLMDDYAAHLVNIIRLESGSQTPLKDLKIIVDAGNGAGGFFVDKVLQPLGANTTGSQFLEPDGMFPNHAPNPEDPKAIAAIVTAVRENAADFGIIFDTDVDRAGAVDKNGTPINRNRFIALMATIVLEKHPGSVVVTDSVTSTGLKWWIEEHLRGKHHRFQRGYRNVINEAIRLNSSGKESYLALETSGHGALKENYFLDDGAYQIAKILIKIAQLKMADQGTIDELIAGLPEPVEAKEIRLKIKVADFSAYADQVLADFATFAAQTPGWSLTADNYEGVHVTCDATAGNGWALLRKSLHDPQLPLNIESEQIGGVDQISAQIKSFLSTYVGIELPDE
ncbi:Phosphomannomutase [Desulfuromusa kysingii]|uniref:Phosphomannomutase n=1 Tax=Desulfuromusa kysingii TaxID=37625 RepID=A0A1H3YVD6_9BACT|nr:phosphomannomutase/phosphoglucomutase [Desulfuromusa kysingii]SEA15161.1 Phosphomannomutase [Desulfuromusa kysingii]